MRTFYGWHIFYCSQAGDVEKNTKHCLLEMEKNKIIVKIIVNVFLLSLYFNYFGMKYLRKFANKAVIITVEEEDPEIIPIPG